VRTSTSAKGAAGKTPASELKRQIELFGLSQSGVAKALGLNPVTLKQVLLGKKKVDIELSLKLSKYFGTTADFWIDLQKKAGLAEAKGNTKLQKQLKELQKAKPADKPAKGAKKAGAKKTGAKKAGAKKAGTKKAGAKKVGAKKGAKTGAKKGGRKPRTTSSPSTPPVSMF
jgi:addiction module HigA family antidote